MIETIKHIDTQIFLFLNNLRASWLDSFVYLFSNPYIWIPLYLFVILLIIKQWKKKSWIIILFLLLSVTCSDQSCNFLKKNIGRLRPSHTIELEGKVNLVIRSDGTLYRGGMYGFPSAHASNSIILLLFFAFWVKYRRKCGVIFLSLWVLLFAYSRIYLGVHYPLDILFGFLLGSCWGLLFIMLCRSVLKYVVFSS